MWRKELRAVRISTVERVHRVPWQLLQITTLAPRTSVSGKTFHMRRSHSSLRCGFGMEAGLMRNGAISCHTTVISLSRTKLNSNPVIHVWLDINLASPERWDIDFTSTQRKRSQVQMVKSNEDISFPSLTCKIMTSKKLLPQFFPIQIVNEQTQKSQSQNPKESTNKSP